MHIIKLIISRNTGGKIRALISRKNFLPSRVIRFRRDYDCGRACDTFRGRSACLRWGLVYSVYGMTRKGGIKARTQEEEGKNEGGEP